jgi:transcriptional regulator with XRE-family HTH domain
MQKLGEALTAARERKGMTLRDVERETGVSNAYLSQLENAKIKQPSPNVLHKLAALYGIGYSSLMRSAGYPIGSSSGDDDAALLAARLGPTNTDEQDALAEYLQFLRSRNPRRR